MSAMKEIHNLAEKNNCFEEAEYTMLIFKMKNKTILILIFIVAKHNSIIKLRRLVHIRF